MVTQKPARERTDYLDALRGLAALIVLIGHFDGAYDLTALLGPSLGWLAKTALCDGFAAVSFFFVLSGFGALPASVFRPQAG